MKYENEWKEIEKFYTQDRLLKSALEKVQNLYDLALKDKAYAQVVKAISYRTRIMGETEEDAPTAILSALKADAEKLPQPTKSIVYAYLGDFFAEYYQNNRWVLYDRTSVSTNPEDFKTWSAAQLIDESVRYYMLSVQDENILQKTPTADFNEILSRSSQGLTYLPTIYDLLGFRALQTLSASYFDEARPQDAFIINDPAYFGSARSFINLTLPATDTSSVKYKSLQLYQRLLSFRHAELTSLAESAVAAYIDLDLRRLSYVRNNGIYGNADELYEKALKAMLDERPTSANYARIAYELAYLYKNQGISWRATQKPEYRAKLVEAYKLCDEIRKMRLSTNLPSYAESLQEEITAPELSLNIDAYQTPNSPMLYKATYRNVNEIHFFIYSVGEDEYISITSYDYKKPLKGKKAVSVQKASTASQPDYQSYSAEMMLQGLAQGHYLVVATNRTDFMSLGDNEKDFVLTAVYLQVYGLTFLTHSIADNKMMVYVTDRVTGKPVEGAKVEAYISTYSSVRGKNIDKLKATYTTGKDGTASVETRATDDRNYTTYIGKLKISHGDKKIVGAPNIYEYSHYNGSRENVVFFTDRAIYRPGQTVYFKGLVYTTNNDGDNQVVGRREVNVELRDVNSKVVSTRRFVSNEFGSIQGSFTLPQGLLNGKMSLRTYGGQHYFSVEEYKRPTFDVTFTPVTKTYKLNDDVKVSGTAKSLVGYAVDNAGVQYRVQRNISYRFYYWWWPPIQDESREIVSGMLTTNDKGEFTIDFKALADDVKNDNLMYTYTVTADITDVNGETRSGRLDLRISNKPLMVYVGIPDIITAGEKFSFPVSATNLNGEATPTKLNVTVSELKSPDRIIRKRLWNAPDTLAMSRDEFVKHFPQDPYGEEDIPTKYQVLKQVTTVSVDTKDSKELDLTSLRNAKSGWYKIDIKARNENGIEVEQQMYVQLESVKPEPIRTMDSWLKTVKATAEPGENAVFTVAGGEDKSYVMYEVMLKNKFIEKQIIKVGKTPKRIEIPIREEHRGGIAVQLTMVQNNRLYNSMATVVVPYTNKMLDISFTTFRDKLQPGEEEKWTLTIKNKGGEKEAAEMAAALYDASLDAFVPHAWASFYSFYPTRGYYYYSWSGGAIQAPQNVYNVIYRGSGSYYMPNYEALMSISYGYGYYGYSRNAEMRLQGAVAYSAVPMLDMVADESMELEEMVVSEQSARVPAAKVQDNKEADKMLIAQAGGSEADNGVTPEQLTEIATRQNFNETAFFYPQLRTNKEGEVIIDFVIPEALTRWKMLGFAHTKDFKVGTVTNELVTQKEVAISANAPRFFRENDKIIFTAKINNLTEGALNGKAMLRLYDATNMQPIEAKLLKSEQTLDFTVPVEGSTGVKWTLQIPYDVQAVGYKLTAQAGAHTDGEEKIVPVLTNSMLVTETMPFSVRAGETKKLTFDKLRNHKSNTLRNHTLTLEYTSNPAWYAVLALPYLMEYPYECAEQTFSRFYANSLASAVTNSSPKVKQIFDRWNAQGSQALLSNLEKNQELKQVMVEETPWVMQADNEAERKKRVAVLFDLNRMGNELGRAYNKLVKMQCGNGGIPWFDGMEPSRYITQHIVAGFAHLEKLNALDSRYDVVNMICRGLSYLDGEIRKDYDDLLKYKRKLDEMQLGYTQVHFLYAASFSKHKPGNKSQSEAFDYYFGQAEKFWTKLSVYEQAMIALTLHRYGKTDVAMKIIASLKERAQQSEEMGMYWADNRLGYFWYQAPIETQALLIEAFNEVANDTRSVEEMKIWLLRQKQTTDWKTTKATSEAVYALLMTGSSLLDNDKPPQVELGGKALDKIAVEPIRPEAGTGYVKTAWNGVDIKQSMGELKATNANSSGIAWGALYWQYFEQLDKITHAETNLKLNKQLFLKKITAKGEVLEPLSENNVLKVGNLVKVRMELRADRDFEYVHLKDMRASGFEPVSTVSGYRYEGGLDYYESVKDASVNFFISYLRKGTYVFEYELRVAHAGDFSNGITTFQCMYAPEFSSHSEGIRIKVE
jgi:uncharacterized protein YfaS (alpha-2-macroglobulin family)